MTDTLHIVLGIDSGRCGTLSLTQLLDKQPNASVTHEHRPLLPWNVVDVERVVSERVARLCEAGTLVSDVASFYLPYIETFIALAPEIRVVCLQRDRDSVVKGFSRWSDTAHSAPTDHWSLEPAAGLYHDPVWSTIFPKYEFRREQKASGDTGTSITIASKTSCVLSWIEHHSQTPDSFDLSAHRTAHPLNTHYLLPL
jgi:hypothetical protein